MSRVVSSDEFSLAYNNKDNITLIRFICNKFAHIIPADELITCGQDALLKCLQQHDYTKQKFTSSLYQFVTWECLVQRRKILSLKKKHDKNKDRTIEQYLDKQKNWDKFKKLNDAMALMPNESKNILEQYCVSNMSFREIGEKMGISPQSARIRYNKAIELARELCS